MPEPQFEKRKHRLLSDLVKEPRRAVNAPPPTAVVREAPKAEVPKGAEPLSFRRSFLLTDDDCPFLGESAPAGTWTCWCSRTVYRNGYPLYEGLHCFAKEHRECGEFKTLKMMGHCGYRALRYPAWLGTPRKEGAKNG